MDDRQVGRVVRAVRQRKGWRQADVAAAARVGQSQVSILERGFASRLSIRAVRAIGDALGIAMPLAPQWRGADLFRLLDADHAGLVNHTADRLRAAGWEIVLEYTFNHYGERGSVDLLGWHHRRSALLIVEVKTRLVDLQHLFASLARKRRIVPGLVDRERRWRCTMLGCVLVVADTTTNRTIVRSHQSSFDAALPARGWSVRHWISDPEGSCSGIQFLPLSAPATLTEQPRSIAGRRRVRPSRSASGARGMRSSPRTDGGSRGSIGPSRGESGVMANAAVEPGSG